MEQTNYVHVGPMVAVFVRLNDEVNGSRVIAIDGAHHIKTHEKEYRVDWVKHQSDKPKGCVAIEVGDIVNGHKITKIAQNPFVQFSEICHTDDFAIDETTGDKYEITFMIKHT